jgi:hypothetical protein
MIISKTNPVGVDFYINKLQNKIHTQLSSLLGGSSYKCYGRCYRNKTDNGYIAENYESENDYKEVYWDDTLQAISFFGLTGDFISEGEVDVHLIYFVNLKTTYPLITHRADEEIRLAVQNVIGKSSYGFNYVSTELWLEKVLKEYPGSRRDERLKFVDMHPVHCFRINLKLLYNPNKIC